MVNKAALLDQLAAAHNLNVKQLKQLLGMAKAVQTGAMVSFAQFHKALKDRGQNPKAVKRLWTKLERHCPTITTYSNRCLEADLPLGFLRSIGDHKFYNISPQVWNVFINWTKELEG